MKKHLAYLLFLSFFYMTIPVVIHHPMTQSMAADFTSQVDDSIQFSNLPDLKMVLIVHNDTYLEEKVADIVRDSLVRRGYTVKTISHQFLRNENPGYYTSSIVFNGIKSTDLTGPAKKYARTLSQTPSNIMFFTVNGETWDKKKTSRTDGVSAATRSINPGNVANKILCAFSAGCNDH